MDAYEAYSLYFRYKQYFSKSEVNLSKLPHPSRKSFESRKDKFFFDKAARKFKKPENMIDHLVSNFVYRGDLWIKDILEEKSEEIYFSWKKKMESLSYEFQQDINLLKDHVKESPSDILKFKKGSWPKILELLIRKKISLESFIILVDILGIENYLDSKMSDDIVWKEIYFKIKKYRPFLSYDRKIFRNIIKTSLT